MTGVNSTVRNEAQDLKGTSMNTENKSKQCGAYETTAINNVVTALDEAEPISHFAPNAPTIK